MMLSFCWLVAAVGLLPAGYDVPNLLRSTAAANSYIIEVSADDPNVVKVRAHLVLEGATVSMTSFGGWGLESGWSTFVDGMRAAGADGREISLSKTGRNQWTLSRAVPAVDLEYRVDLSTAIARDWPDGPRTIGVASGDDFLYLFGGSFLIYGAGGVATVSFDLPAGWTAATPWEEDESGAFVVADVNALTNNAVVVGDFDPVVTPLAEGRLTVVGLGAWAQSAEDVAAIVAPSLDFFGDMFGVADDVAYLVVLFEDRWQSGEAFQSTFVAVGPADHVRAGSENWTGTLAHETAHFWNGQRLNAADWSGSQWFSEGATDYISHLFLLRTGRMSVEEFLDKAEKRASFYLLFKRGSPFERVSLVEAGNKKSPNQPAIYDGGWIVAFTMDAMIRDASDGERGLENMMRDLLVDHPDRSRPYTNQDLVDALASEVGERAVRFYEDYVAGLEIIDIREVAGSLGLEAAISGQEVRLTVAASSSDSRSQCLWLALLAGAGECLAR